jgi:hypothetical protein
LRTTSASNFEKKKDYPQMKNRKHGLNFRKHKKKVHERVGKFTVLEGITSNHHPFFFAKRKCIGAIFHV